MSVAHTTSSPDPAAVAEGRERFRLIKPRATPWREIALTQRTEIHGLAKSFAARESTGPNTQSLCHAIDLHLCAVQQAVTGRDLRFYQRPAAYMLGACAERAFGNLDKAEFFLLRLAPDDYVIGQLPSLYAQVRSHLRPGDPRLDDMKVITERYAPVAPKPNAKQVSERQPELSQGDREAIAASFDAMSTVARREVARVRSFRNTLLVTAAALWLAVAVLTIISIDRPALLPMCFMLPESTAVCPTHTGPQGGAVALAAERNQPPYPGYDRISRLHGSRAVARAANEAEIDDLVLRQTAARGDVALIELVGIIAAAVAAAVALRSMNGTATPYSLPMALAFLKVPTGALTAVLGIVLLRGEFIPGLTALDTPGQIVAWAAVFGASQQLVTRLVDQRAQETLDKVGTPGVAKAPDGTTVTAQDGSS
jgi:hypothetical protein